MNSSGMIEYGYGKGLHTRTLPKLRIGPLVVVRIQEGCVSPVYCIGTFNAEFNN